MRVSDYDENDDGNKTYDITDLTDAELKVIYQALGNITLGDNNHSIAHDIRDAIATERIFNHSRAQP